MAHPNYYEGGLFWPRAAYGGYHGYPPCANNAPRNYDYAYGVAGTLNCAYRNDRLGPRFDPLRHNDAPEDTRYNQNGQQDYTYPHRYGLGRRDQVCVQRTRRVDLLPNCGARTNARGSGILGYNSNRARYLDYVFEIFDLNPNDRLLPGEDAGHFHLDAANGRILEYIPVHQENGVWVARYRWDPNPQERRYLSEGRIWVNFHSVDYPDGLVSARIPPL